MRKGGWRTRKNEREKERGRGGERKVEEDERCIDIELEMDRAGNGEDGRTLVAARQRI